MNPSLPLCQLSPFKQLRYNDNDVMFATLDAGHVQKALARAVRSSVRKVKIGNFFATCLMLCDCYVKQTLSNVYHC